LKRPVYDYHDFRLNRLGEPKYAHIRLMAATWLFYFAFYFITENLIPAEACHPVHCALDDVIPFCEYFAVFYVGWYLLVAGSLAYYLWHDVQRFRELDLYIFVTQFVAMAAYILYPSRQDLRPEFFSRENICTAVLGVIYAFDTNTGVCPSLHVAYSIAIFSVMYKDRQLSAWWKVLLGVLVVCIACATTFVKQHSAVDVLAAIPTALIGEYLIYHTALGKKLCRQTQAPALRQST